VLSFGSPFALIPLLIFCRNRNVMGMLVNHKITMAVAPVVVALIVSLNIFLLYQAFFGAKALAGMVLIGAMEFYGDTVRESASSR
jgi:Mn2+/Fe2+ NRAMP family transporter